jgi:TonB family protein
MEPAARHLRIVKFGVFEVDLEAGEVRKSGMRQKLAGQAFEVLRLLLERPQEIVSREELRQRIWPKDISVDYDLALKKAVNRIREVLGDLAESPRFIETIPRRGYRFIAPVTADGNETTLAIQRPSKAQWLPAIVVLVVLLIFSLVIFSGTSLTNWRSRLTAAASSPAHAERRIQDGPMDLGNDPHVRLAPKVVKKRGPTLVQADPDLNKLAEPVTTIPNATTVSTSEGAGTSRVKVETAPQPRIEALYQNIPPDVVRARIIRAVLPKYPPFAIQAHVTGTVEIGLSVSPRGDVYSARVLIGHPMLMTSALEAMRQWRFEPNRVQGVLTWSRMRALVRFRLDGTTAVAFAPPMLADSFGDLGSQRDELRDAAVLPVVPSE